MGDEDYEIISRKDIAKLKQEIKELKEGKDSGSANNVMNKLNQMLELFKDASLSIKTEKPTSMKLDAISEKLDKILDQNQKVAEGLLSVVDLVKGVKPDITKPMQGPKPVQPFGPRVPGPMPGPAPQPLPRQQRPPIQPQAPGFPKPGMPSLNPMQGPPPKGKGELRPLPSKPAKKGLFRKK